jgi:FtsH-binding integral membrane protein
MQLSGAIKKSIKPQAHESMSDGTYNFTIGALLCWGLFVNWLMIQSITVESILAVPMWAFLVGYFVLSIAGVLIVGMSSNPLVGLIGYNMIVAAFGAILCLAVSFADPDVVFQAVQTTGLITAVMMFLGSMFPAFFKRISGALFISLLVMIVVELVQIFVLKATQGWTDWVVIMIFCGFIGHDWAVANEAPRNFKNALNGAVSLYMNIINIFVRLLDIYSKVK